MICYQKNDISELAYREASESIVLYENDILVNDLKNIPKLGKTSLNKR